MSKKDSLKDITFKFSDDEISLFQNTFCENTKLLRLVQNAFLQLEMSLADKTLLNLTFKGNKPLLDLMRKKLIAELDPNTPLGFNTDIWSQVHTENTMPELVLLDAQSKQIVINLLEEGLKKLENIDYEYQFKMKDLIPNFNEEFDAETVYVNIKGRNDFMNNLIPQMYAILQLAGRSGETIDSIKTKLAQNSTK